MVFGYLLAALGILLAACGGGSGEDAPPQPAEAPLTAVTLEWGQCFADPEEALEGVRVVQEDAPPHDMLVTLKSGEQFRVPAGESSGATPANEAASAMDAACDR